MSGFLQGKAKQSDLPVIRFGYLISATFLILTNLALFNNWAVMPWLFLLTMYFLTGSLWIPAMIRPLYNLFGKYIIKERPNARSGPEAENMKSGDE